MSNLPFVEYVTAANGCIARTWWIHQGCIWLLHRNRRCSMTKKWTPPRAYEDYFHWSRERSCNTQHTLGPPRNIRKWSNDPPRNHSRVNHEIFDALQCLKADCVLVPEGFEESKQGVTPQCKQFPGGYNKSVHQYLILYGSQSKTYCWWKNSCTSW